MIRLALAMLLWASTALAQDSIALRYQVTGVAVDDRLNIRAEPSASAEILGNYPPDATHIEVLGYDVSGRWAEVGLGEQNGWVALRFITPMPDPQGEGLPRPLRCFGAEPFWSLTLAEDGIVSLSTPEGALFPGDLVLEGRLSFGYVAQFRTGSSHDVRILNITGQTCSDGMSDRVFRWEAILTTRTTTENLILSGCCTLDPR